MTSRFVIAACAALFWTFASAATAATISHTIGTIAFGTDGTVTGSFEVTPGGTVQGAIFTLTDTDPISGIVPTPGVYDEVLATTPTSILLGRTNPVALEDPAFLISFYDPIASLSGLSILSVKSILCLSSDCGLNIPSNTAIFGEGLAVTSVSAVPLPSGFYLLLGAIGLAFGQLRYRSRFAGAREGNGRDLLRVVENTFS